MLSAGKSNTTRVQIKREALSSDGYGGYTETWTALYRRIKCRFNALNYEEMEIIADKQGVKANYTVYLEYLSGIREGDRLVKENDLREFEIKLTTDWDKNKSMMKLFVLEVGRLE